MAGYTVFHYRRMLPKKGPSGFGVTFKAFQVDVLGVDQFVCDGTMGVVAIRALHLAFPDRMMRLSQQLRRNGPMACDADFRLGGFGQIFGMLLMNIVTIGAGKRSGFMFAGVPHGDFTLAMTLQANRVLRFRVFSGLGTEP
jgi:hypothetical protein